MSSVLIWLLTGVNFTSYQIFFNMIRSLHEMIQELRRILILHHKQCFESNINFELKSVLKSNKLPLAFNALILWL
jgi:hypothetical protein